MMRPKLAWSLGVEDTDDKKKTTDENFIDRQQSLNFEFRGLSEFQPNQQQEDLLQSTSFQFDDKAKISHNSFDEDLKFKQSHKESPISSNSQDKDQYAGRFDKIQYREHLQQLQSIDNLLLDLPSQSNFRHNQSFDNSSLQSTKTSSTGEDMSISDLFGLGLPRGSLMSNRSTTSTTPLSSGYRHYQSQSRNYNPRHQRDDGGYYSMASGLDASSSPNSTINTPTSPSTLGSVHSNPNTYTSSSSNCNSCTASSRRVWIPSGNSSPPSSPLSAHSACYGRPIRGSPSYSDCGSPRMDHTHLPGCNVSRAKSPAESETSGMSSMDRTPSDVMTCLSLNSSSYGCHSSMSLEPDLCPNNKLAMQRMPNKKCQNSNAYHHHHSYCHGHNRYHHYEQPEVTSRFSNNNYEKNCCSMVKQHVVRHVSNNPETQISLDRAANHHRNAAALCDPSYIWVGKLPKRTKKSTGYSCKVFFGGLPYDITDVALMLALKQFGQIRVEWPGKENSVTQPKGYAYIIFESENQVKSLLSCCTYNLADGVSWYFKISSKRMKGKPVQVIPWALNESNYVKSPYQRLEADKTVFVGALHGMLTAEGLATVMEDLFQNVMYAGIDTDKHKYPIGSARITFGTRQSYLKAVAAAFVEIQSDKFRKKVQIDPYIQEAMCSRCNVQQGPYFCRELVCFRYFCRTCWQWQHYSESMSYHNPMTRDSKTNQVIGLSSNFSRHQNHCSALPGI